MSSFKNAAKSHQKTHRERSQPSARQHLGLLEKKKDYRLRADDYQKKQRTITALKRKAQDRNPDEFYFKMVRTKLEDGVHQSEDTTPQYTEEQLKLMDSQDLKYITFKRSLEQKKIEKLKGSLHLLDVETKPKNKHTVFLDYKKQVKEFSAAKYLDTHPALLGRTYNRPRLETLKKCRLKGKMDEDKMIELAAERSKQYKLLGRRIDREKQLSIISQKMEMKKHLKEKKSKKKKMAEETVDSAAVYQWVPQRKR